MTRNNSGSVDLGAFTGKAEHLLDCQLLRSNSLTGKFAMDLRPNAMQWRRAAEFETEAFEAFVMRLRPFGLENDSVFLPKVWRHLERTLPVGPHRNAVADVRVRFFREIGEGLPRLSASDWRGGKWQDAKALWDMTVTMMSHARSDNMAEWDSLGEHSQWFSFQATLMLSELMVACIEVTRMLIGRSRDDGVLGGP